MKKDIETYLDELKIISGKLSDDEIKLDEAITLYKEGVAVANEAEKILEGYEKEIEVIFRGDE